MNFKVFQHSEGDLCITLLVVNFLSGWQTWCLLSSGLNMSIFSGMDIASVLNVGTSGIARLNWETVWRSVTVS
jgi:hypothetical protein